jgi:hypothetical protein
MSSTCFQFVSSEPGIHGSQQHSANDDIDLLVEEARQDARIHKSHNGTYTFPTWTDQNTRERMVNSLICHGFFVTISVDWMTLKIDLSR